MPNGASFRAPSRNTAHDQAIKNGEGHPGRACLSPWSGMIPRLTHRDLEQFQKSAQRFFVRNCTKQGVGEFPDRRKRKCSKMPDFRPAGRPMIHSDGCTRLSQSRRNLATSGSLARCNPPALPQVGRQPCTGSVGEDAWNRAAAGESGRSASRATSMGLPVLAEQIAVAPKKTMRVFRPADGSCMPSGA